MRIWIALFLPVVLVAQPPGGADLAEWAIAAELRT